MKTTVSATDSVTCHIGQCFAEQVFSSERLRRSSGPELPVLRNHSLRLRPARADNIDAYGMQHSICCIPEKLQGLLTDSVCSSAILHDYAENFYIKIPDSVEINRSGCLCVISTVNAVTAFKHADNLTISSTTFDSL